MRQPFTLRNGVRLAAVLRRLAWFVIRPRTIGAQVVVLDGAGRVLLVRHSYDRGALRLPGGGTRRAETFAEGASRELREETGLVADPDALELLGVFSGREGHQAAFIAVFVAPDGSWTGHPRGSPEIDSAEFHDVGLLPADTSPATRARIAEAASGRRGISGRW